MSVFDVVQEDVITYTEISVSGAGKSIGQGVGTLAVTKHFFTLTTVIA